MAPTKVQQLRAELLHTKAALNDALASCATKPACRSTIAHAPTLSNHILFLFVGPGRELITFHSDLLPERTKAYFIARAAAEPLHQLPDESVEIMYLYRLFLYTGILFSKASEDKDEMDTAEHNDGASMDAERTKLMECYILGAHLHDERFRNAVINALVQKVKEEEEYPTGLATEVYEYTTPGDKLWKLIVDFHVWQGQGEWLLYPHEDANGSREFLSDVATAAMRAGVMLYLDHVRSPWELMLCTKYHDHVHTPSCVEMIDLSDDK